MNKTLAALLAALLLVGVFAVVKNNNRTDKQPEEKENISLEVLPYGRVNLKVGETARFADLTIRPLEVTEDSRCPANANCIWAGTVKTQVEIVSGMGTSTNIIEIGKSVTTEAEEISFISVEPVKTTADINTEDYLLTFEVVKRSPSAINPGTTPNPNIAKCYVGGCSGQICSDKPDMVSTCEYRPEYSCYRTAKCERQSSGQCGWTETPALLACLANPPQE